MSPRQSSFVVKRKMQIYHCDRFKVCKFYKDTKQSPIAHILAVKFIDLWS
jgi:hypothetical protein